MKTVILTFLKWEARSQFFHGHQEGCVYLHTWWYTLDYHILQFELYRSLPKPRIWLFAAFQFDGYRCWMPVWILPVLRTCVLVYIYVYGYVYICIDACNQEASMSTRRSKSDFGKAFPGRGLSPWWRRDDDDVDWQASSGFYPCISANSYTRAWGCFDSCVLNNFVRACLVCPHSGTRERPPPQSSALISSPPPPTNLWISILVSPFAANARPYVGQTRKFWLKRSVSSPFNCIKVCGGAPSHQCDFGGEKNWDGFRVRRTSRSIVILVVTSIVLGAVICARRYPPMSMCAPTHKIPVCLV